MKDDELDAGFLMWDVRRFARVEEFPEHPVVIQFSLRRRAQPSAVARAWPSLLFD